jgi:hypothetical protein
MESRIRNRTALMTSACLLIVLASTRLHADTGTCGGQMITLPFTDVPASNVFFCSIAQIYFQGITLGTSPTTYSPSANVTRDQMAAFLSRTQNSMLNRGSRRAALNQFWTTVPQYSVSTPGGGTLGTSPTNGDLQLVASDGTDLWLGSYGGSNVQRLRASDGKLLENWTGATNPTGVLVAMGRVFVTGKTSPGSLYMLDPRFGTGLASPSVTVLSNALGNQPQGIAFDGAKIWTANNSTVSILTPGAPFTVTNVGSFGVLFGIVYDGANIWVTEYASPGTLKKLDASGAVIDLATVGNNPQYPIFDGTNIWVPNSGSNSVTVVRATDGEVLATLTGNGLNGPRAAAFDGQRILVTNYDGHSVSLFRAADFAPLGSVSAGANSLPWGVCSDGLHFWIVLSGFHQLARF